MKNGMGLCLVMALFSGVGAATAGDAPSLKVSCNVSSADLRLVHHLPAGSETTQVGKEPVALERGERYTLVAVRPGYSLYRKSFSADWSGVREKDVELEREIGPAENQAWVADLEDKVFMEFVPIPAGSFMMGSDDGEADEQPVHQIKFARSFWMAKTEVTTQQYEQYAKPKFELEQNEIPMPKGATYPQSYISWKDAMGFCRWLTRKEQRRGHLPEGYEYTLPTEAEWEYACRAGTTTDYAGALDAMAWYRKNSGEKTNPVGKKKANAWGLYDMHGNVWEWCFDDWFGSYDLAPVDGSRRGNAPGEYDVDHSRWGEDGFVRRLYNPGYRVVRGGSWSTLPQSCRSANRFYHPPDYKLNNIGFRPVLLWNPPLLRLKVTDRPGSQ